MTNSDHFVAVINLHKGIIFKVANSYSKNREDCKDLAQEIILQVWRSFSNYKADYQYSTWIYRIALNVAISYTMKEKLRNLLTQPMSDSILSLDSEEYDSSKEQVSRFLHQFIQELKPLDKALTLLYLEGKSYQEISEIMGLSETNISTKIYRIKSVLKQKFSDLK